MPNLSGRLRPAIALATATIIAFTATSASAVAIVPGQFDDAGLGRNDDNSTILIDLGFTANFFGQSFDAAHVNNNGNITFDSPLSAYTPFDLTSTEKQIIAPFFADVDTSFHTRGKQATYGKGMFEGRDAFGVNWIDVDYYLSESGKPDVLNSFQLILVDRSDIADGDFDIVFNYDKIQWETGTASGGDDNGLGGDSARVGYSNGSREDGTFFELDGSAVNGAFLDNGPLSTALIHNRLNSDIDGRYIFGARNGTVTGDIGDSVTDVPEPSSLVVLLMGLLTLVPLWVRRQRRSL